MQGWSNQGQGNQGFQSNQGFTAQQGSSGYLSPPFNPNQDVCFISALDPNLVLDVSQDHETKNKLILWKKHGMKNQRFRISEQNGKYVILNFSGGVLGV